MHINPIYRKELKLSTRSLKLPIFFTAYIIILTVIACVACAAYFNGYSYSESQYAAVINIFNCLCVAEFAMIMFEIPAFTADAIAGERERQTLDILLTTSLKPIQIVIGKLLSSLSSLFFLTFLSLPVLGITFAVGGIHLQDIAQLFLFILISMFFIGSLGIFFSAALKRTAVATILSYVALFFIIVGTMIIILLATWLFLLHAEEIYQQTGTYPDTNLSILPMILLINPAFTMFYMLSDTYGSISTLNYFFEWCGFDHYTFIISHWFWISLFIQILLGTMILYFASKKLDPLNKKEKNKKKMREISIHASTREVTYWSRSFVLGEC